MSDQVLDDFGHVRERVAVDSLRQQLQTLAQTAPHDDKFSRSQGARTLRPSVAQPSQPGGGLVPVFSCSGDLSLCQVLRDLSLVRRQVSKLSGLRIDLRFVLLQLELK